MAPTCTCRPVRIQIPTASAVPSTSDPNPELRKRGAGNAAQALRSDAFAARLASHMMPAEGGARHDRRAAIMPIRTKPIRRCCCSDLARAGAHIAFPRVSAKDRALEFHRCRKAKFCALAPLASTNRSSIGRARSRRCLLVPLLAFDGHGYRLGYGGGYYDRTLAALSKARAIGIAYAGQRMDFLPHDAHDYPLDMPSSPNMA